MAWRDSRASRRRLLLFSTSITFGVAALVALGSFRHSLARAIDEQARSLIGADLIIESTRPFTPEQEQFLQSLGEPQAREVRFTTMAVFPRTNGTRLIQLRALEGEFPFYGKLETEPPAAAQQFRQSGSAIAEESLLIQFGAKPGDLIKIGDAQFTIAGALKKMPGEASAGASLAPRVYLPLRDIAATNLLKPGSIARYRDYLKFAPGIDAEARIGAMTPELRKLRLEYDSVAKRKKDLGTALQNVYRFLNLIGFISLLLGAVGVASAIHAHLEQKRNTSAVLRCLGLSRSSAVLVYLTQAAAMGIVGGVAGALLGVAMQQVFPRVLQSLLPMQIPTTLAFAPIIGGVAIGFATCILFSLPPLLRFRHIAPLEVLRADASAARGIDFAVGVVYVAIALAITAFAISQSETWRRGVIFAGALGIAVAIFAGVARLLIVALRRFFPRRWSFVLRQGLANLYRPNNRTFLLTLSLGLGTFLLLDLYLTREVLLAQFSSLDRNNQANIFLFDIQPDQTAAVRELVASLGLPVMQEAPIVTMRLASIKGQKTSDILADRKRKIPEWELDREYRCTYREQLASTEKIVDGKWIGRVEYKPGDVVPISIDQQIARDFKARIGDELVFDVQGILIRTRIASLRDIDWKRFQTNFFVVFPAGVLENAPTFNVLVSRVRDAAESARLQSAVAAKFPNVSAIDLTSVIQTVDSILTKAALVIRIISLFTVGAGIVVLASAIWSGRYQRVKESILLRTLGASRAQLWKIMCAEYFILGLLASVTGIVLAVAASWGLAHFVFKLSYAPSIAALFVSAIAVTALTVAVGLLTSRGVGSAPPLAILRSETD
jgi:putative ABC transport system permease protein